MPAKTAESVPTEFPPAEPCGAELAFRKAMRADPGDDTVRLVYADWLDDRDRPFASGRLRWWVKARAAVRAAVVWDDAGASWDGVTKAITRIRGEWVRRLYSVEVARIICEKYPLSPEWAKVAAVCDDSLSVAERYALLTATNEELSAAWTAAWYAAEYAAGYAAWYAAESAARSAAWYAAESAARSAAESAAEYAAESAAWSAARSAAESAARSAAESAARSAARSAAWSAARSAARSAGLALARITPVE